ncbi:MAG: hypothetical protein ABIZ81_01520 [Opitutaceae bacterium]
MNLPLLILSGSLALNVALLALTAFPRGSGRPNAEKSSDVISESSTSASVLHPTSRLEDRAAEPVSPATLAEIASRLRAAGLPAKAIRAAIDAELSEQLKATLGETRYAEYVRAKEYEFQRLADLSARSGLPSTAAVQVFGVRDFVSSESNRIYSDATLDLEQKRAAMKMLAGNARLQITRLLGPAAAEAYARQSNRWLNPVEQGSAVTFTENGQSSRPLR